ncbi:hypothetical protein H0V99_00310 [Candidatus Saccharibacteria bacterium]|nr:hypothetical protein [Candidatus Saccharibacteria bacterium]
MANYPHSRNSVTETRNSSSGGCGYELNFRRQRTRTTGGAVVLFKGGLGDVHSVSLEPLANAVHELSRGQVSVGTVGTIRPLNPVEAVLSVISKKEANIARTQRSKSTYKAAKYVNNKFQPEVLIVAGQSEGSVSVVDAVHHWLIDAKNPGIRPRTGAVTIDGPAVYETMAHEGIPVKALWQLLKNCWPDIKAMSTIEKLKMAKNNIGHFTSPWEPLYFVSEIDYLRTVDISPKIATLRENKVVVRHAFHSEDVVSGAERALFDPNAWVYPGRHVRIVHEPEPVAADIVTMAEGMLEDLRYSQAA